MRRGGEVERREVLLFILMGLVYRALDLLGLYRALVCDRARTHVQARALWACQRWSPRLQP